jgi:histidine triad (HIT) family protein
MKKPDCIFCKIIEGTIPSIKVFENDRVIGFKDLHPAAQIHFLFVHKNHTRDINEMMVLEPSQIGDIFSAIRELTLKDGIQDKGFRVVTNTGQHGGQTVFHTHFHVLGGEQLRGFN